MVNQAVLESTEQSQDELQVEAEKMFSSNLRHLEYMFSEDRLKRFSESGSKTFESFVRGDVKPNVKTSLIELAKKSETNTVYKEKYAPGLEKFLRAILEAIESKDFESLKWNYKNLRTVLSNETATNIDDAMKNLSENLREAIRGLGLEFINLGKSLDSLVQDVLADGDELYGYFDYIRENSGGSLSEAKVGSSKISIEHWGGFKNMLKLSLKGKDDIRIMTSEDVPESEQILTANDDDWISQLKFLMIKEGDNDVSIIIRRNETEERGEGLRVLVKSEDGDSNSYTFIRNFSDDGEQTGSEFQYEVEGVRKECSLDDLKEVFIELEDDTAIISKFKEILEDFRVKEGKRKAA